MLRWSALFFVLPIGVFAQTCCSGGIPVSANIGFAPAEKKVLQFSLSYDLNQLTRLYNEQTLLNDNNRLRSTHSYIFRLGYQWQERLATEVFFPFILQERRIQTLNNTQDWERSSGLGDPAVLLSYDLFKQKVGWTLSLGLRLPLGSFTETNERGLLLVNDMQPGSGALDWIMRSAWIYHLPQNPDASFFLNVIHARRGENDRYLGSQAYRFGRETQVIVGHSRTLFIRKSLWPLALGLRYRHTAPDELNAEDLVNTGGAWLFARANWGYAFNPQTQLQLGAEYPLLSKIRGVQLSPDYILNLSLFSKINLKKDAF